MVSPPSAVVIPIRPVDAPDGTRTVNCPNVTPVGGAAGTRLKFTAGVPALRFAPMILTEVPTGPKAGEKLEMVGPTTKFVGEKAEAPGTTTRINPVIAPAGTAAVRFELFKTEKVPAGTPPK